MESSEKITSLGEYLKESRIAKGMSVEEIVRESNISKKYLEALENNDFDAFPGETYILGFINTYSDILEADKNIVHSLYKKHMRIAQDSPVEQLVGVKRRSVAGGKTNIPSAVFIIVGVLLLIGLLYLIINFVSNNGIPIAQKTHTVYSIYELDKISEKTFMIGDTISITNQDKEIRISFNNYNAAQKTIEVRVNNQSYPEKEKHVFMTDTDGNNTDDLSLEILSIEPNQIKISVTILNDDSHAEMVVKKLYADYVDHEEDVLSADMKEEIKMNVMSTNAGWMAYSVDGGEEKQVFLKKQIDVPIAFKDWSVLSLANAGSVLLNIGSTEIKGGELEGAVNKSVFYWKKKDGKYVLVRMFLK